MSGIYVNFSDEEASSESIDIEPLPSGKYLVVIDECDLAESKSEKNFGKLYYKFRFNVIGDRKGGMYLNRKCWTNAMLFSPALYTISHILKACGMSPESGQFEVPDADWFLGQEIMIGGLYVGEQEAKDGSGKKYAPKFEPKSFWSKARWTDTPGTSAGTPKRSSLLS